MPPQSTSSWMQPHSVAFMSYEQASCWFKILLQAREWVSRVGEEPSMLKTRICLLESLVHEGLVLDCWQAHCIPLFHMQPWCATLCFMDLHDLASLLLSRCMQSQHPSVLPFHDNGLCPSSFLSSSLCSPFHSWGSVHFMPQLVFFFLIYISVYFPFIMPRAAVISSSDLCPPLPTSSFQGSLCPTICGISCDFFLPDHSVFIFLPFSWTRDPSGCMPRRGKIGKKTEGDTAEVNILL